MVYEKRFAKLQHRDSETSLDPTPNRMFSSGEGRWLSPDPLFGNVSNPQSLNRYAYALNTPNCLVDPSGLIVAVSVCHDVYGGDGEGGETYLGTVCSNSFYPDAPGGGGSGGGGGLPYWNQAAINYLSTNKSCQKFILQTIQKVFALMNKGGPLTAAQQQADTLQAFEKDLSLMNITRSPSSLPYGAAAQATTLSTVTVAPDFSTHPAAQQSEILIHEVLHLGPPGGTSYTFLDRALADAWGLTYDTSGSAGQVQANASAAFQTLLQDPKNCGPAK